jgi:hypothetical protein
MHSYGSPLTPLFPKRGKRALPFEKGGIRGILKLIAHYSNM